MRERGKYPITKLNYWQTACYTCSQASVRAARHWFKQILWKTNIALTQQKRTQPIIQKFDFFLKISSFKTFFWRIEEPLKYVWTLKCFNNNNKDKMNKKGREIIFRKKKSRQKLLYKEGERNDGNSITTRMTLNEIRSIKVSRNRHEMRAKR